MGFQMWTVFVWQLTAAPVFWKTRWNMKVGSYWRRHRKVFRLQLNFSNFYDRKQQSVIIFTLKVLERDIEGAWKGIELALKTTLTLCFSVKPFSGLLSLRAALVVVLVVTYRGHFQCPVGISALCWLFPWAQRKSSFIYFYFFLS